MYSLVPAPYSQLVETLLNLHLGGGDFYEAYNQDNNLIFITQMVTKQGMQERLVKTQKELKKLKEQETKLLENIPNAFFPITFPVSDRGLREEVKEKQ